MREISAKTITDAVSRLCQQANCFLPDDVVRAVDAAYSGSTEGTQRDVLGEVLENARVAGKKEMALCQDTGITDIFVKLGQDARISGGTLAAAINEGVSRGYAEGYLRKSIVADPLARTNTGTNTPANISIEVVPGDRLEVTVLPKGGGSENASALKMLEPTAGWDGIRSFVLDLIRAKGINACPPLVVGIGVGGSFSTVAGLAKKSLLRELGAPPMDAAWGRREKELLAEINATGIGPMGLGGTVTALAVHIEAAPCHIACLPVAVSMQCHSCRRKTETI